MSDVTAPFPVSSQSRRQALRSQRRWRVWQGIWRFSLLMTLSAGLGWGLSHPHWLIRSAAQIEIEGNQLVSRQKIDQMLKVSYPQTLWMFPSQRLKQQLQQQPPISEVELTRSLFPPAMILKVEERQPVAIASSQGTAGFLDAKGVFIPQSFYNIADKRLKFPFKVLGYQLPYQEAWQTIYPLIQQSPVKIPVLDWRNANNLILQTELGQVYLGPYGSHFSQQLKVLSQMTALSSQIPKDRLIYIDLSNPNQPIVQLKHEPPKPPTAKDVRNP